MLYNINLQHTLKGRDKLLLVSVLMLSQDCAIPLCVIVGRCFVESIMALQEHGDDIGLWH